MHTEEADSYARARLTEIFNDTSLGMVNPNKQNEPIASTGMFIRTIDDGFILPGLYLSEDGNIFGLEYGGITLELKPDAIEKLASWAAESLRERGIPVTLACKQKMIGDYYSGYKTISSPKIYIDLFLDPIKCAKRYGIDDSQDN